MRTQFDVQLEATSNPDKKKDGLHFRLSAKNYNDLAAPRVTPLMLVVLELPPSEADWLACTVEHLTIGAYPVALTSDGEAQPFGTPAQGSSFTVHPPERGLEGAHSIRARSAGWVQEPTLRPDILQRTRMRRWRC